MNLICALSVFLLAIIPVYTGEGDVVSEDGVLVLTQANFDKVISSNEFVLVEFYTPWCYYCIVMNPDYVKAAKTLADKGSPIKLGKVNGTEEVTLTAKYNVRRYPTLLFYKKDYFLNYQGMRTAEAMVSWLEKKSGDSAKVITTAEETMQMIENNTVVIIGFFTNGTSEEANIFLEVADKFDKLVFIIITNENMYKQFNASNADVILFKKFDDKKSHYKQELTVTNLTYFITIESRPLVIDLTADNDSEFLGRTTKNLFILFLVPSDEKAKKMKEALRLVAKGYLPHVFFMTVNVTNNDRARILQYFKIKEQDTPTSLLLQNRNGDFKKYKPKTNVLTKEIVKDFVQSYLDNKLKPYLFSQDLPSDWNTSSVYTLVQSNFNTVVLDETKHVFVDFYAPWCGPCKAVEPIYKELSNYFKERKDLIFAKMDLDANELENCSVRSFPTLILYKKKDKKGVHYSAPRKLEEFKDFIRKECIKEIVPEDSDETD